MQTDSYAYEMGTVAALFVLAIVLLVAAVPIAICAAIIYLLVFTYKSRHKK